MRKSDDDKELDEEERRRRLGFGWMDVAEGSGTERTSATTMMDGRMALDGWTRKKDDNGWSWNGWKRKNDSLDVNDSE